MELDERIEKLSDIFNCFNAEKAKQFIGQKGYFANDLNYFSNIHSCYYDTLAEVKDCDRPFKDEDCCPWSFFIPESFLNPKEKKKLRPYKTFGEFPWGIGGVLTYRSKSEPSVHILAIVDSKATQDNDLIFVCLGGLRFTPLVLFKDYEYLNATGDKWLSFGVEE